MQAALSDSALDALVDTLGMPEPEPEVDLSSIVEVEEVLFTLQNLTKQAKKNAALSAASRNL